MKTEQLRDELARVIADMAERNMALDGNGNPILYNDEGIAQAVIDHLAPMMREVAEALEHAKSWRPFGEALAMHFNDVICPVEQALASIPEVWRK